MNDDDLSRELTRLMNLALRVPATADPCTVTVDVDSIRFDWNGSDDVSEVPRYPLPDGDGKR